MHFDFTVSMGQVIEIVTLLLAVWRLHERNVERFNDLENKVGQLIAWYDAWMHSRFHEGGERSGGPWRQ
jgi:hypothetical protein